MKRWKTLWTSFVLAIGTAVSASAQTPLGTAFTYQGQLKKAGAPLNATADFQFGLWDALVGGGQLGAIVAVNGVTVSDGLFTVWLDFGATPFEGEARWLQIAVRSPAGFGQFTTLAPRQPLTAAPNALFALNADKLDGLDSSAFLQSIPVPLTLSGTSPTHIIRGENASAVSGASGVYGLSTAGTYLTYGVYGESSSISGMGIYGLTTAATGTNYGVYGKSASTSGRGVSGVASAATGITYGVIGSSSSTSGRGVQGSASASTGTTYGVSGWSASTEGTGVFGEATAATGVNCGVYGRSASTLGCGVFGWATADTGYAYGGYFQSAGTNGTGVVGYALADTGVTYGVSGWSASTTGRGVFGQATAATGLNYGVYGQSASTSGRGVYGEVSATTGRAVFGNATSNTSEYTPYGVFGQANATYGYAVWAQGRFGASGTKSFRIDHPDDPENKYLIHYSAESPEVVNFYRGTVRLDGAGEAVVALPHYFAKTNKTPSYQLTAVGAPMPNLHVAEEIDEAALVVGAQMGPGEAAPVCSFRIAGGKPGAKVSWEVKAVRNDRWVRQRGAPVEVEKQGLEKGTYQHPELYGQPPAKGMDYQEDHEVSPNVGSTATPR